MFDIAGLDPLTASAKAAVEVNRVRRIGAFIEAACAATELRRLYPGAARVVLGTDVCTAYGSDVTYGIVTIRDAGGDLLWKCGRDPGSFPIVTSDDVNRDALVTYAHSLGEAHVDMGFHYPLLYPYDDAHAEMEDDGTHEFSVYVDGELVVVDLAKCLADLTEHTGVDWSRWWPAA